jgi:hypothetical protein
MLLCCGSQTRDWIGESSHITFLSIYKKGDLDTTLVKLRWIFRPNDKPQDGIENLSPSIRKDLFKTNEKFSFCRGGDW